MNSLSDLNSHSRKGVAYVDTGTYNIAFTSNGTWMANLGNITHSYQHMPRTRSLDQPPYEQTANTVAAVIPFNITALTSVANTISIDFGFFGGPTDTNTQINTGNIFFPNTLPSGTTVTYYPGNVLVFKDSETNSTTYSAATKQCTVSGINSVDAWNAVSRPIIQTPSVNANFLYAYDQVYAYLLGNVHYTSANNQPAYYTFRHDITVNSNLKISNAAATTYTVNQPRPLTSYPQVWANIANAHVYVMPSISSAIDRIATTATAGSVTFDNYSKCLTIKGTGAEINNCLAGLTVTPATDSQADLFLNYTLRDYTATGAGFTSNVSQFSLTSSNVAIHSVNQQFTANSFTRTRTFDENGYGLLFPDHVPVVANVGTGNYTISMTLSSDTGIIGLGESFTTPVGWTAANLNYSYTGNLSTTNTTLSSLRYFARPGSALKPTVTYTQRYNGTTQFSTTFRLVGQANTKIVGGTTSYNAYEEQVITNVGTAEFYPSVFSNYAVMYRGIHGGIDNNAVYFTGPNSDWHNISNAVIYKQFAPAANVTAHIANLNEARTANIRLGPDYTNDVAIEQILGIESYVTGSSLGGGSQYRAVKPIAISPTSEFSLTDAYSVPWDWSVPLDIQVTDYDTGAAEYTANIRQLDFATRPGWLVFTNNANVNYGNITVTGTKSAINTVLGNISYYRPINTAEPAGGFRLEYTQSKVSGNVTSATYKGNIVVNNYGSSTVAVSLPATATLGLVTNTYITGTTITDPIATEGNATVGNIGKTYSFSLTQSNPIGYFWLNGANVGTRFTTSGNITNINATIANIGFDCNTSVVGTTTTFTSNVVRQIIGTGNVNYPQYGNTVISSATCVATTALQNLGDAMGGGYYAGQYSMSGNGVATHYLVVAPRVITGSYYDDAGGFTPWANVRLVADPTAVTATNTTYDGATNTTTIAAVRTNGGSPIQYNAAIYCDNITIDKYSDWYLPSYYEMEVVYYNGKPATGLNTTSYGTNPYAVPQRGSNYTTTVPARSTNANMIYSGGIASLQFSAGFYYKMYYTSTEWAYPTYTGWGTGSGGPILLDFGNGSKAFYNPAFQGQNCAIRPIRKISI